MELLIFSDSHGRFDGMQTAIERAGSITGSICHLGDGLRDVESLTPDCPVYSVRGNCDWESTYALQPTELLLPMGNHTLFLTHGHLFSVKGGMGALLSHAVSLGADIILFGHTHKPLEKTLPVGTQIGEKCLSSPVYLFNPGSIGYDEDGEGLSFGRILIRGKEVLLSHGRI